LAQVEEVHLLRAQDPQVTPVLIPVLVLAPATTKATTAEIAREGWKLKGDGRRREKEA